MHPNEPSMEELKKLYHELIKAESTNENIKRLKALDAQMERRRAEDKAVVDKETKVKEAADGDTVLRGRVLIAPGDRHTLLQRSGARRRCRSGRRWSGLSAGRGSWSWASASPC